MRTASQCDCQGQRKIQLSIAKADHTIKLYQLGKTFDLLQLAFPENLPSNSAIHQHPADRVPSVIQQPATCL